MDVSGGDNWLLARVQKGKISLMELLWYLIVGLVILRLVDYLERWVKRCKDKKVDEQFGLIRSPHEVGKRWFG